jgi:hypothetical protein
MTSEEGTAARMIRAYESAKAGRSAWESLWQDCYDYALPQRSSFGGLLSPANRRSERLYDATALDAADQLAASLLGHLTPTFSPWFGFRAGSDTRRGAGDHAQARTGDAHHAEPFRSFEFCGRDSPEFS